MTSGGFGPVGMPSPADLVTTSTSIGFEAGLVDWTIDESGGTPPNEGNVALDGTTAVLSEGNSFLVTLGRSFTVPDDPVSLTFTFDDPEFDLSNQAFINDAFEAALVGADGNSLVHTIADDYDAFFNVTEDQTPATAQGAWLDGNELSLDISHLGAGSQATIVFRRRHCGIESTADVTQSVKG